MADKPYTVMIAGVAKSGMEDYVRSFLIRLMDVSKKDEGCITYNIHESTENPGEFMLYSVWKNESSFEQHNNSPLMLEFKKELAPNMFEYQSPKTYWKLLS